MATCLRSENFARADFTCARSRISGSRPQSAEPAAPAASIAAAAAATRSARLAPVVIEIEPVVRSRAAVVLEPLHIAAQRLLDSALAVGSADIAHVGKHLEVDIVAVAAAIDTEHQNHRPAQHGRNTE